jgi:hypothetical protein
MSGPGLEQLDFLYMPSRDVGGDVTYFSDVLGGRVVFAIDSMGTRVAAVDLGSGTPLLLFAGHLDGDAPVLVYRAGDLHTALDAMEAAGWKRESTFEIPHGPICSFRTPGGHRIAVYQPTRPDATAHFEGRRDF